MIANTTLTLLRGVRVDELGDEVDEAVGVAGAVRVPASLIERTRTLLEPSTGTWRAVRYSVARFAGLPFPAQSGDLVRDETTGRVYFVDYVRREPRSLSGLSALSLELSDTAAL